MDFNIHSPNFKKLPTFEKWKHLNLKKILIETSVNKYNKHLGILHNYGLTSLSNKFKFFPQSGSRKIFKMYFFINKFDQILRLKIYFYL